MNESFMQQQLEAIARETMQHAVNYSLLLNAIRKQLRTRGMFLAQAQSQWWVMQKQPRRSKPFTSLDDAIAYAFELYEAQHE